MTVTCAIHPDVPVDDDGTCIKCDIESMIEDDTKRIVGDEHGFGITLGPNQSIYTRRPRHGPIVGVFTAWCWWQRARKTRRLYVGERVDIWVPAHVSKVGTFKQGIGTSRVFSFGVVLVRWWYEPKATRPSLIADVRNRVAP